MPNIVVVGAQWGDEGKGKIVDLLSRDATIVARCQGGANAGHTVVRGRHEYVFHLIPSGILNSRQICVIGNGVVVDPRSLWAEISRLHRQKIGTIGRLFVSESAHVTLPYHCALDAAREERLGQGKIGTTQRGIGPTYADKAARVGIRLGDLLKPEQLRHQLAANLEEKNFLLETYYHRPRIALEPLFREYVSLGRRLKPYLANTSLLLNKAIAGGKSILFEGAQGTLLDLDLGTYPYVTSSNTCGGGACTGLGIGPTRIDSVLGVAKAYTTRVGAGPFPTELSPDLNEALRLRGREYGATTGRPWCGWFDAVAVRHAVTVNGINSLAITKLDVLDGLSRLCICTGYRLRQTAAPRRAITGPGQGGQVQNLIVHFPSRADVLSACEPVYEEVPGWVQRTRAIRRFRDLPRQAREYLKRLEELVGVRISLVSVGPQPAQTIRR